MPEPTEPRPDVPDDLAQIGVDAWQTSGRVFMDHAVRAVLAAVLPAHERMVRAQVASQLDHAAQTECGNDTVDGMRMAASIARGDTS